MSNWPHDTDYGHSNWTGSIPRSSRHYQSGYIEGSEAPPCGWFLAIVCAVLVVVAVGGFFTYAGALVGLS